MGNARGSCLLQKGICKQHKHNSLLGEMEDGIVLAYDRNAIRN